MCGDRCECNQGMTCIACGAPVIAETSAQLAGGTRAHHGCVGVYGLQSMIHDDRKHDAAVRQLWNLDQMTPQEGLQQALLELEQLRSDPELSSAQRRGLRRIGLYASASLAGMHKQTIPHV